MKTDKKYWLWLIAVFLVLVGLFVSSSMTYQQQTSVPFLEKHLSQRPGLAFLRQFQFNYGGKTQSVTAVGYFKFLEFLIRKLAHLSVFALLAGFSFMFLKSELRHWWVAPIVAWLVATGIAGFDEFHESLTGGRTPLIQDVMLDSVGAIIGIFVALICWRIYYDWRHRKQRKH
ncbi:VanZ family protein [Lactobacillus sp. DCY120]|uniref:VanZ family protein n=1 Tax=Bombilactobacillus apium TaxID=2675299 RepID=A0A850R550_9LACO|nr:VanZ family protein [Bombilactobacillus apium]NVY97091.1 VanZ family protein [Bombilactobacillus apium]